MIQKRIEDFFSRIDKLTLQHKPSFGKMNVHQMICHCTDLFRLAFGEKEAEEYGKVDPNEIIALARKGKTVPTPKGFNQTKGEGTKPVDFAEDKIILKKYITRFAELPPDYKFSIHPYFGDMERRQWENLVTYHLDHHLKQFGA